MSKIGETSSRPANVTVCLGYAAGCNQSDSVEDMVQCDTCESWWHYSCAKVDEAIKDKSWSCVKCPPRKTRSRSGKSSKSKASGSSSSSVRRAQLQLELKRLEEAGQLADRLYQEREEEERKAREEEAARREKRFAEKQAREEDLLQKRFALLQTLAELDEDVSEGRSEDGQSSVVTSKSKVENWMSRHMQGNSSGLGKANCQTEASPANATYSDDQAAKRGCTVTLPTASTVKVLGQGVAASGEVRNNSVKQQVCDKLAMIPYPMRSHLEFAERMVGFAGGSPDVGEAGGLIDATIQRNAEEAVHSDGEQVGSINRIDPSTRIAVSPLGNNPLNSTPLSGRLTAGPSAQQLAARHVVPKDLPIFFGDPVDWPLFISN
nr:uncharacterized protein LOC115269917 [Aedes albopictus]